MRLIILVQVLVLVAILSIADAEKSEKPSENQPVSEPTAPKKRSGSNRNFGPTGFQGGGFDTTYQAGSLGIGGGTIGGAAIGGGAIGGGAIGGGAIGGGALYNGGALQSAGGFSHVASSHKSNMSASSESSFVQSQGGAPYMGGGSGYGGGNGCAANLLPGLQTMSSNLERVYQGIQGIAGTSAGFTSSVGDCEGRIGRVEGRIGEISAQIQSQSSTFQRVLNALETVSRELDEVKLLNQNNHDALQQGFGGRDRSFTDMTNGVSRVNEILQSIVNKLSDSSGQEMRMLNQLQGAITSLVQNIKVVYDALVNDGGNGLTNEWHVGALDKMRQEMAYSVKQEIQSILDTLSSLGGNIGSVGSYGDQFTSFYDRLSSLGSTLGTITTMVNEIRSQMGQCRPGAGYGGGVTGGAQGLHYRHHKKSQSASSMSQQEETLVSQGPVVQSAYTGSMGPYYASRKRKQ